MRASPSLAIGAFPPLATSKTPLRTCAQQNAAFPVHLCGRPSRYACRRHSRRTERCRGVHRADARRNLASGYLCRCRQRPARYRRHGRDHPAQWSRKPVLVLPRPGASTLTWVSSTNRRALDSRSALIRATRGFTTAAVRPTQLQSVAGQSRCHVA